MDGECKQSIDLIINMSKTKTKGFDVPAGFPIPFNKSVILEKVKEEAKAGRIILNESSEENNVGRIMAAAADCNPLLEPGKKVMYNIMENRTIRHDGNYYLIMHEIALFCIIPEEAILMPESISKRVKEKDEKIAKEQKRLNDNYKKELNKADQIMEKKKKIFNKKK